MPEFQGPDTLLGLVGSFQLKFQDVQSLYFLPSGGPDNIFWNSCSFTSGQQ